MCARVQAADGTGYQRFNTQDGYVEIEVPLYLEGGQVYATDALSAALTFGKVGTDFFHMDTSRDITVLDKPIMMEGSASTDRLIKVPVRQPSKSRRACGPCRSPRSHAVASERHPLAQCAPRHPVSAAAAMAVKVSHVSRT